MLTPRIAIVGIALSSLLSGCIIIPFPHQEVEQFGAHGKITAPDGSPIVGAKIESLVPSGEVALSDIKGKFIFPAKKELSLCIAVGMVPKRFPMSLERIKVTAPGYCDKELETNSCRTLELNADESAGDVDEANLGTITLQPTTTHANQSLERTAIAAVRPTSS